MLARLWPLVSQESLPRWFRPFAEVERTATSIRSWEPLVIPGLLQTEDYSRALITAWQPGDGREAVQQQVTARIERQQLLEREAEHPKIIVQVVPLTAGAHPGLEGPLVLVARRGESDLADLEVQGRGQLVESSDEVARYGLLYDLLRAVALRPMPLAR